jgi:hypothetical protein
MLYVTELGSTIKQVNTKSNFIRHAKKRGLISYKVCVEFHIFVSGLMVTRV